MAAFSPYLAFSQGNSQGPNMTQVTKPISVLDKETMDSAKIYPQFQLNIPTTTMQQKNLGQAERRSESNSSALSYGTRPANR
jgi:hypothetical protein